MSLDWAAAVIDTSQRRRRIRCLAIVVCDAVAGQPSFLRRARRRGPVVFRRSQELAPPSQCWPIAACAQKIQIGALHYGFIPYVNDCVVHLVLHALVVVRHDSISLSDFGIDQCPIRINCNPTARSQLRNALASSATSGTGRPYMTSATIDASEKNVSTPVVTMAAGAVPALTASSSTAVVVDEPA